MLHYTVNLAINTVGTLNLLILYDIMVYTNMLYFHWTPGRVHVYIRLYIFKNRMHSFEVSLGYENVDRSTFSMKCGSASC